MSRRSYEGSIVESEIHLNMLEVRKRAELDPTTGKLIDDAVEMESPLAVRRPFPMPHEHEIGFEAVLRRGPHRYWAQLEQYQRPCGAIHVIGSPHTAQVAACGNAWTRCGLRFANL